MLVNCCGVSLRAGLTIVTGPSDAEEAVGLYEYASPRTNSPSAELGPVGKLQAPMSVVSYVSDFGR